MVLDRCTVQEDNRVQDDRDYNVLYNYEFIEDYNEESESQQSMYVHVFSLTYLFLCMYRVLNVLNAKILMLTL